MARPQPQTADRGVDLATDGGIRAAWQAHAGELFGYARRALGNAAMADEAVQETFVRAWRAARSYDRSRPLRPWLFAILRHVVIDQVRAHHHDPGLLDVDAAAPSSDRRMDQLLDDLLLQEALLRIRDDQRVVLVETYYRARSYADVASELGVPEATARTRAFYGLRALRLALEEMGWDG